MKPTARLDVIAILRDDIGEPEVQDASKVDPDSAGRFCREAALHARNGTPNSRTDLRDQTFCI